MLGFHSIESRANAGAPSDSTNPSKIHRLVDHRSYFAPGKLAQGGVVQIPSRSVVCCGGARPESGGFGATGNLALRTLHKIITPRTVVTGIAQHNLVHPDLRESEKYICAILVGNGSIQG